MRPATTQSAPPKAEPTQYLTFSSGSETFAIGILGVKEIIEYAGVTEVPMMSECVRGVINLRGAVVTVMDLAARFGRPRATIGKRSCVIIVELEEAGEQHVVGILVDSVSAVLEIAAEDIEPSPGFGARIRTEFIAGMGKVKDKFVILLDVARVFSIEEIALLQAAGAGAE
jgi:purine-binding chemotaxis protein CheW